MARAEARVELSAQSCGHLPLGVHSPDPKDIQPVRGSVSVLLCLGPSPSAPESASMEPGSGQCMLCGSHSGAWATEVLALLFPQPEVSLPKPLGLRVEAQRSGLPAAAATATAAAVKVTTSATATVTAITTSHHGDAHAGQVFYLRAISQP